MPSTAVFHSCLLLWFFPKQFCNHFWSRRLFSLSSSRCSFFYLPFSFSITESFCHQEFLKRFCYCPFAHALSVFSQRYSAFSHSFGSLGSPISAWSHLSSLHIQSLILPFTINELAALSHLDPSQTTIVL